MTELGSRLKEARQAKGLSLDDLQEITKIQKRYLKGIEEGNYDMMPGKFYVRAFIKQYAEAVGLETDQVFEEYKSDVPEVYNDDLPEQISRVQSRKTVSPSTSKVLDVFPKILVVIFVIAAIFLAWWFITKFAGNSKEKLGGSTGSPVESEKVEQINKPKDSSKNNKENEQKEAASKESEQEKTDDTKEEKAIQELKVENTNGKFSTYQLLNTDKFEVKIVSTGETWVDLSNDKGQSYFQGIVKKGDSKTIDFSKDSKAVLNIGKVPETEIYINDEKVEYAVSPSDYTTQLITIQFAPSKTE
ncbi:RodZ domain-containing protein [Heyndrickxia sporothermodurans]